MRKIAFILLTILTSFNSQAAELRAELSALLIPDSLKKDAHAVVRYATTSFELQSTSKGVRNETIAITVLDKKGESFSNFYYPGDKYEVVNSFSGKMYDASGNLLKKYKLSDVQSTEWSTNLASDARQYFFGCNAPSFPFTIVYEYEVGFSNGILRFPGFFPQDSYNLSVEKANYQLTVPENTAIRIKAIHLSSNPTKTTLKGKTTYEWNVNNLVAIDLEKLDPGLDKYIPQLYVSPQTFEYDKVAGSITDWNTFGLWINDLLKGRDLLTEETKQLLIEKTKHAKSDREKVKILYDYLGENTHYVSIQLGIGGFQPMLASEVCKTKFGDCKALTNYLKSMLAVVGIASNYCVIRLDENKKDVFQDYANFGQFNHVILQVPLPGDTLWLECTNPRTPFGFAHNGISGHDVLVCTNHGGELQKVKDYGDETNIEKNKATVELGQDGSAKVTMQKKYHAKIYDDASGFPYAKPNEQIDELREDILLPNATVSNLVYKEDKSSNPSLTIDYNWNSDVYGSKTGNRLFLPVNPFRTGNAWMKTAKRKHDLLFRFGYQDIDSLSILVPEGYVIESIPASEELKTTFGSVVSQIKINEKEITIYQKVFVSSGTYPVSAFPEIVRFFEKIATVYKGKIILKKV